MNAYIKGPWEARQNDFGQWCVSVGGEDIAKTPSTHRQPRARKLERKANAVLMAASPKMLDALRAILAHRPDHADAVWDQVEEAIAIAEGR